MIPALEDRRSKRVVFLSHCILNENVRYLGGACRAGCIREIVEQCIETDLGIVQMQCPEQRAWGGVLKRYLLMAYGLKFRHPLIYRFSRTLLPIAVWYTRLVYRYMARQVASQIEDYLTSGFSVIAVVGIDGSPSCGVSTTIHLRRCDPILRAPVEDLTPERLNRLLMRAGAPGMGIFTDELQKELRRRHLTAPFLAHNLWDEMAGKPSSLVLPLPLSDTSAPGLMEPHGHPSSSATSAVSDPRHQ